MNKMQQASSSYQTLTNQTLMRVQDQDRIPKKIDTFFQLI